MNWDQDRAIRRRREKWGCLAAVGSCVVIAIWLLLPSVGGGPPGPRTMSTNNLKWMGLGFQNHHDLNNALPAGVLVDGSGQWLHGWHTQLLPYIEYSPVYDEIDLTKSWKDPANVEPLKCAIPQFLNPRRHWRLGSAPDIVDGLAASHYASNVLVVGGTRRMKFGDITDGLSNTVLPDRAVDKQGAQGSQPARPVGNFHTQQRRPRGCAPPTVREMARH
jgi:hypothetical protein